ncbi:lens fiber major intrinsic protein-like isoform X1 [Diorhabda carinulata]|uniref:lens fiber major intrinsic protein-like isoform X1 n=1 Tax=Diorhabda carinulata TaxID=1163345 RepID=UPI0025A2BF20|nr:lens fiber major intrinsic protein-like isoform X1 [Diorhabda carinulata]
MISEVSDGKPTRTFFMNTFLLCCMSEFFGTAVLLFLSCTGATLDVQGNISILHVSFATGLAVTAVIQMLGHISGAYINPAVTLSAFILEQINLTQTIAYMISQILGCLVGTGFHKLLTPTAALSVGNGERGVCVNAPGNGISELEAFGVEVILTIILVVANCSSWDKRNSNKTDSIPLKIGLVVVSLNLSAAAYTGASMNPARSFGPAVVYTDFTSHWIYWAAPIVGSLIASLTYKFIFLQKNVW